MESLSGLPFGFMRVRRWLLRFEGSLLLAEPAMLELKNNFSSWDEVNEIYFEDYAYWLQNDVTEEGTTYRYKVALFGVQKYFDITSGILFDPEV